MVTNIVSKRTELTVKKSTPVWITTELEVETDESVAEDISSYVRDADAIILISGSLPEGLTYNPNTMQLHGTVTSAGGTTFKPKFRASNSSGQTDQIVSITVTVPVPVWHTLTLSIRAGTAISQDMNDFVSDATSIIYISGTYPVGLTYDSATSLLAGTPDSFNVGATFRLRLRASNSSGSSDEIFAITVTAAAPVDPPAPPTPTQYFSISISSLTAGQYTTFTVSTVGSTTLRHGHSLSASGFAWSSSLSAGTFNANGTPSGSAGSSYTITATGRRGAQDVSQSWTFTLQ